jgi:hypothetical protein
MARSQHIDAEAGGAQLSFLSGPEDETQHSAEETPPSLPQEDNKNFDEAWTFSNRLEMTRFSSWPGLSRPSTSFLLD